MDNNRWSIGTTCLQQTQANGMKEENEDEEVEVVEGDKEKTQKK